MARSGKPPPFFLKGSAPNVRVTTPQVPPLNNSIPPVNIATVRPVFMGLEPALSLAQLQPPWNTVTSSEDGESDTSQ